jgi:hypothetical protein
LKLIDLASAPSLSGAEEVLKLALRRHYGIFDRGTPILNLSIKTFHRASDLEKVNTAFYQVPLPFHLSGIID